MARPAQADRGDRGDHPAPGGVHVARVSVLQVPRLVGVRLLGHLHAVVVELVPRVPPAIHAGFGGHLLDQKTFLKGTSPRDWARRPVMPILQLS